MPARDFYHNAVRNALLKDGWRITHDPLRVAWGRRMLYVDLGAERLLGAEKGDRRIAVEVKSFVGMSDIAELETALGQFILYRSALAKLEPRHDLILAFPRKSFADLLGDEAGQELLDQERIPVLVFDPDSEDIVRWIP